MNRAQRILLAVFLLVLLAIGALLVPWGPRLESHLYSLHAPAWIQAGAGVGSLILAAVLAWGTWKYVRLTRDLVAQNQRTLETAEQSELARRRRMAIGLHRHAERAASDIDSLTSARALPGNVAAGGQNLVTLLDNIIQSSIDVGAGLEIHALAAGQLVQKWIDRGRAAIGTQQPGREAIVKEALASLASAGEELRALAGEAAEFIQQGEVI